MESNRIAWDPSPDLLYGLGSLMNSEVRAAFFDKENPIKFLSKQSVKLSVDLGAKYRYSDDDVIALGKYERTLDSVHGKPFELRSDVTAIQPTRTRHYLELGVSIVLPTYHDRRKIINPPFFGRGFKGDVDAFVHIPKTDIDPNLIERRVAVEAFRALFSGGPNVKGPAVAPAGLSLRNPVIYREPVPIRSHAMDTDDLKELVEVE
jgi:hypothetical protein